MTLKVIVTRTQPFAQDTAKALETFGLSPVVSPMLVIQSLPPRPEVIARARHLVFTSASGISAAAGCQHAEDVTVWCVGPTTSAAAEEAGFTRILEGPGNADDLAAMIMGTLPRPQGLFVHVANEDAAGRLVAQVKEAGFEAEFLALYRTEPAAALTPEAQAVLAGKDPSLILLHSAKAAAALSAGSPDLSRAVLVAISEAALAPLKGRAGLGERIAHKPRESDLMHAVLEAAAILKD